MLDWLVVSARVVWRSMVGLVVGDLGVELSSFLWLMLIGGD